MNVHLIHLSVETDPSDTRTADEIGAAIMGAIEVGDANPFSSAPPMKVYLALAEQIEGDDGSTPIHSVHVDRL